MMLPNAHLAIVEDEKVIEYLLNPIHPDNGGKAAFFQMLGFDWGAPSVFSAALRKLAVTGDVFKTVESGHGSK